LSKNYNSEVGKLLSERNEFKAQLDALGDEHKTSMRRNEQEIKALNEKLSKALKDLAEINTAFKGLNEAKSKLEIDFDLVSQKSERQRVEINDLTSQLEQLRNLFESSSKESKLDLKVKLDVLNRDLDAKWAEILRLIDLLY
jgi:predicted  nucleic acid-binding Zn-ribbon protein